MDPNGDASSARMLLYITLRTSTLPETSTAHEKKNIFLGKYHQHGGFSMAILGYRSVFQIDFLSSQFGMASATWIQVSFSLAQPPARIFLVSMVWWGSHCLPKFHDFLLHSKNQHQRKNTYLLIATTLNHWDILTKTDQTKPQTKTAPERYGHSYLLRCFNVFGMCVGFGFKIHPKYWRYGLFTYKTG